MSLARALWEECHHSNSRRSKRYQVTHAKDSNVSSGSSRFRRAVWLNCKHACPHEQQQRIIGKQQVEKSIMAELQACSPKLTLPGAPLIAPHKACGALLLHIQCDDISRGTLADGGMVCEGHMTHIKQILQQGGIVIGQVPEGS